MSSIETINATITGKLNILAEASKLLENIDINDGTHEESKMSPVDIDFIELDDTPTESSKVQKLLNEYMSLTINIRLQYKNKQSNEIDIEYLEHYNSILLSNNILVKLDDTENIVRNSYNNIATYINRNRELHVKYKHTITQIFGMLNMLDKMIRASSIKLRSKRKESEINECPDCKVKMMLHATSGEYRCSECTHAKRAYGIVPSDVYLDHTITSKASGNYRQEDNCEIWLNKLQGMESKKIPKSLIKELNKKASEEHATYSNDKTCYRIRMWLKDINQTNYNNHTPKIRFLMTGIPPEKLTDIETQDTKKYFKPVMDAYNKVKPDNRKNSVYQPYIILKILEQVVNRGTNNKELRFLSIVSNIHFQDIETIQRNDEIMSTIGPMVGLKFSITDIEYYTVNIL